MKTKDVGFCEVFFPLCLVILLLVVGWNYATRLENLEAEFAQFRGPKYVETDSFPQPMRCKTGSGVTYLFPPDSVYISQACRRAAEKKDVRWVYIEEYQNRDFADGVEAPFLIYKEGLTKEGELMVGIVSEGVHHLFSVTDQKVLKWGTLYKEVGGSFDTPSSRISESIIRKGRVGIVKSQPSKT